MLSLQISSCTVCRSRTDWSSSWKEMMVKFRFSVWYDRKWIRQENLWECEPELWNQTAVFRIRSRNPGLLLLPTEYIPTRNNIQDSFRNSEFVSISSEKSQNEKRHLSTGGFHRLSVHQESFVSMLINANYLQVCPFNELHVTFSFRTTFWAPEYHGVSL